MSEQPSDETDNNDRTDELPVLVETVVLDDATDDEPPPVARVDDTSEQTAIHRSAPERDVRTAELEAELAERNLRLEKLEAQVATLTHRDRELELELEDRERRIGDLSREVAALRNAARDTGAADRLSAEIAARDQRMGELSKTIARLEREAAARSSEVARLQAALVDLEREAAAAKAAPAASAAAADVQALLEEKEALAAYIATRRTWWDEAESKQSELTAKIAALQGELAASTKRLKDAEAFAAQESSRAVTLRAELVDYARRVADLEREQRSARALEAAATAASTQEPATALAPAAPAIDGSPLPTDAAPREPVNASDADAGPASDAVAQLEAEVEYKRQQVAAQLVELHERDTRLRAAAGDLDRSRREVADLRTELDQSLAAAARLERAIIDKDRALEARDARIATLQGEIKQRAGELEKLGALDFARFEIPPNGRATPVETHRDNGAAPALVCLTGDAPKRLVLSKKMLTIGRGPHCDLQILTHFVSREHARITMTSGHAIIEDAGSRNGVFVNSVRVERQVLQHGDLITIGDTQFRFVESVAH